MIVNNKLDMAFMKVRLLLALSFVMCLLGNQELTIDTLGDDGTLIVEELSVI